MTAQMNRDEILRRLERLLDSVWADEAPPAGIDPEILSAVTGAGETEADTEADRRCDSYSLWAAVTALTQEVKLQGRAFLELNRTLEAQTSRLLEYLLPTPLTTVTPEVAAAVTDAVRGAVPIPVVSPRSNSSAPISIRSHAISATFRGSTSYPSNGHPSTTEIYALTLNPCAFAPVITSRNRSREVAMLQLRFFSEKDSVAAAKTDISMNGGLEVGSAADSLGMPDSSGS